MFRWKNKTKHLKSSGAPLTQVLPHLWQTPKRTALNARGNGRKIQQRYPKSTPFQLSELSQMHRVHFSLQTEKKVFVLTQKKKKKPSWKEKKKSETSLQFHCNNLERWPLYFISKLKKKTETHKNWRNYPSKLSCTVKAFFHFTVKRFPAFYRQIISKVLTGPRKHS